MNDIDIIRKARARLDTDDGKRDPGLSVYMIRDLEITKQLELDDLAWSFERSCGAWSEAVWLLDKLAGGNDMTDRIYNRLTYIHTDEGESFRVKAFTTNTPGLVVTKNGDDFWRVTHEESGLSIGGDIYDEENALLFANDLANLGVDFTQSEEEVTAQCKALRVMGQIPAIAVRYGA